MAIGTVTLTETTPTNGPVRFDAVSFLGDASYPTGGTAAFDATVRAALAVGDINVVGIIPCDCGGYTPVYDNATGKLKVYYGDYDPAAAGPMVEVPNATVLSAVTFRVIVLSK